MTSKSPVPVLQSTPAPYLGPASYDASLLDVAAAPCEGVWISSQFAKAASIEFGGTFSAVSAQLVGSNSTTEPLNAYTATVAGSIATNDVVALNFANPNLAAGVETVSYTVQAGDDATAIAAGLAAAVNADAKLQALGIVATSAVAVITITYPNGYDGAQEGASPTDPASQNFTLLTSTISPGSETVTIANASAGQNIGSAITAAGITAITPLPKWIKLVLASMTGTKVTANFHGVA